MHFQVIELNRVDKNIIVVGSRSEAAILAERISDLRAKVKLWGSQTKISTQAEVQVLLHKVDAASSQVSQLEQRLAERHVQIQDLNMGKRDLLLRLGRMVPVSELNESQAEASKLREDNKGMNQLLRAAQKEIDGLKSSIQVLLQGLSSNSVIHTHSFQRHKLNAGVCRVWCISQI